jgi:methionyl aminopeptidase
MITLKTPEEIEIMAEGGRILGEVLRELRAAARAGITTKELDALAYKLIIGAHAVPAFLNYRPHGATRGYPATLCASVNDGIVHGLPSKRALQEGDVLKLDLGLRYKGFCSDAAITVGIGKISREANNLIKATEVALAAGIKEVKIGKTLGDVGYAIETIAQKNGCSVAEGLTGHGIGKALHEDPYVFNFGERGKGDVLKNGMVIAIEPMFTIGAGAIRELPDDSYVTMDGSLAAHFEHTIAITEKGPRILTK